MTAGGAFIPGPSVFSGNLEEKPTSLPGELISPEHNTDGPSSLMSILCRPTLSS